MTVSYGTREIEFEVIRSESAENSYITVERDIGVIIKAPCDISNVEIKKLVKKKAKWIVSKLEEIGQAVDYGEVVTGSRIFYLGKSYYVEVTEEDRSEIEIQFLHSKFKIFIPMGTGQRELSEAIDCFYKQRAEDKIIKLVKKYSDIMKLFPQHVGFRKSKTKWGSCSERDRLTFNPEIIKLSSSLIEYAVIHELSHIAFKSHSKDFWALVKKYMSDYLKKEEKLRVFEKKL